jgi:zinc-ribbon domain
MPEEENPVHEGSEGPAAREWGRSSTGEPPGEGTAPVPQAVLVDQDSLLPVLGGLHHRAQELLLKLLFPGERPRVVVPGAGGSVIVGTGERALVVKPGGRFGGFRERAKAFEYESVIGVRLDTDTMPAVVAIDAPHKIGSCRVYWADARDDPWKARNAIPVEEASFGTVLERVIALRGLVIAYREGHPALAHPWERAHPAPPVVQPIRPSEAPEAGGDSAVVAPLPVFTQRCPHCRAELRPGWRFCPECGSPSETASAGQP